jgi:hypothetical protein
LFGAGVVGLVGFWAWGTGRGGDADWDGGCYSGGLMRRADSRASLARLRVPRTACDGSIACPDTVGSSGAVRQDRHTRVIPDTHLCPADYRPPKGPCWTPKHSQDVRGVTKRSVQNRARPTSFYGGMILSVNAPGGDGGRGAYCATKCCKGKCPCTATISRVRT